MKYRDGDDSTEWFYNIMIFNGCAYLILGPIIGAYAALVYMAIAVFRGGRFSRIPETLQLLTSIEHDPLPDVNKEDHIKGLKQLARYGTPERKAWAQEELKRMGVHYE